MFENQDKLNEILRIFDQSFPAETNWKKVEMYELLGESQEDQNFYQIDLYRGCLFKNGK